MGPLPDFFQPLTLERVGSTNEEAKRLAARGAGEGLLIVAGEQTAGRGRRQRAWLSPPGNLYASLLLRPARSLPAALAVGFVAANAIAEAIAPLLPAAAEVRLKWPNDVLIGGRKVAGILLETAGEADGMAPWLVLGVGVNVVSHPPPALTRYPATSLRAEGAAAATAEAVLEGFAGAFLAGYHAWLAEGFAPVRRAWLARAHGLRATVDVQLDEATTLRGRFLDLAEDGALVLEEAGGRRRRIAAGDVFPVAAGA